MKFSKSFATILVVSLALAACAKKDSDFAAKYAKNRMGAEAVDTTATAEATERHEAEGIKDLDVISVVRAANAAEKVITSVVIVNQQQATLTTRHTGTEMRSGQVSSGNLMISAYAVCQNANCNPYYLAVQLYKDGKLVAQEGIRKYFDMPNGSTTLDRYAKLTPERSLPLLSGNAWTSADMYNGNVMVGYLNGNSSSGGTTGSQYIK